jgi:hypothetical protein
MFIPSILRVRFLVAAALVLVVATAAYGFAAANTFTGPTKAGAGEEAISGYAVSGVKYVLDGTDPTKIASVEFDLDAPATNIMARFLDAGTSAGALIANGLYDSCSVTATTHYTCVPTGSTPPLALVSAAKGLQVIAHD